MNFDKITQTKSPENNNTEIAENKIQSIKKDQTNYDFSNLGVDKTQSNVSTEDTNKEKILNIKNRINQTYKENNVDIQNKETEEFWYRKAQEKAEIIIQDINPDMSVTASYRTIALLNGEKHTGLVLYFKDNKNTNKSWTMEIAKNDEYINTLLEKSIKKIYDKTEEENSTLKNDDDVQTSEQNLEKIYTSEKTKTIEEIDLIDQANEITDFLRKKYNMPKLLVPPEAIHIILKNNWNFNGTAFYDERTKTIFIKETEKKLLLKKRLIHEMLHAKTNNLLPKLLNEALVESMTIELMSFFENDKITKNELLDSKQLIKMFPNERTSSGNPVFSENTFLAYLDENKKINSENFTYKKERSILSLLISKIQKKNTRNFATEKQAFDFLVNANIADNKKAIIEFFGAEILTNLKKYKNDISKLEKYVGEIP
jgi:hypothetical protein